MQYINIYSYLGILKASQLKYAKVAAPSFGLATLGGERCCRNF